MSQAYHGSTLEGNACRFLIGKADALLDQEILGEISPLVVQPYIANLKSFDKLVTSCFSAKAVKDDVQSLLAKFKSSYLATDLSVTLKVHAIFDHLIPTLNLPYLQGRGLVVCTEQAGESIHSYFAEHFWKKWKVNSLDHPEFANFLKRAVVEFSSKAL